MEYKVVAHPHAEVLSLTTCVSELLLISGASDGIVHMWNVGQFDIAGTIYAHDHAAINSMCVVGEEDAHLDEDLDADNHAAGAGAGVDTPGSPARLITGCEDGTLRVWVVVPGINSFIISLYIYI